MQIKTFRPHTVAAWLVASLLLFAGTGISGLFAAEEAAQEPEESSAPALPNEASAGSDNEVPGDSETADSVGGQMGEVSLDKFIPTEEISADGAVSFPVDI